jgi:lysozyme
MNQFSPAGLALLKAFERCSLHTYDDADPRCLPIELGDRWHGVLTIAWGHVGLEARPGATLTQAQADALLAADLAVRVDAVRRLVTGRISDNQFSALCCLAFNIGLTAFAGSSALHLANNFGTADVPAHIALWNKSEIDGQLVVSPGLVSRRAAECALWALPDNGAIPDFKAIGDKAASA